METENMDETLQPGLEQAEADEGAPDETETENVNVDPEMEELRTRLASRDNEVRKLQSTVARHAAENKRLNDQAEAITSLQRNQALLLDKIGELLGETPEPQPSSVAGRHVAAFEREQKERGSAKTASALDPDIQTFVNYLADEKLSQGDPIVKEAMEASSGPLEAIDMLKPKVEKLRQDEAKKHKEEVDKLADEKVNRILKERGLTAGDFNSPGGSSSKSYTRAQIAAMPMEQYQKEYEEIQKAMMAGKIK